MKQTKIVFIDSVRSAHNVGSIFRTSDGAGITKIILGGYTPAPVDRFGRVQLEIKKTSLGASSMIVWEQKVEINAQVTCVLNLKNDGFTIVALEQTPQSISLYDFKVPEKVVYIVGNEIDGVSKHLLELCDVVVEIPMLGQKESLNVGVSAGILLFHK